VETLLPEAGGQLPAITARLRSFAAAHPSSPVGHFLLAQALAVSEPGAGQIETLLREAIRVEPKFWPAHFEIHKALLARGEIREAAGALERTAELNPDYAPARYALAQVYASLGDRVRAAAERRAHHELVTRGRAEAQARTAAMPPLPYRLLKR
jgi:predicted Zn-dependent protease